MINTKEAQLGQAYRIDRRIDSKMQQVKSLRDLAVKATSTISNMPRNPSPNLQPMETIVERICELEEEIVRDIDTLVDVKKELYTAIKQIQNVRQQMLLELRYLCFKTWSEIAEEMNCSDRDVYRLHESAKKIFCAG
ncbi:hypothetical protein FACS18948_3680 [Clostridia bacterium]|nr:hypothetical protein FACS18948_3680 [Clostridia bacterium]